MRVTQARVAGRQTIYRAELHGVVLVCEWNTRGCTKADSASVVNVFQRCREAHNLQDLVELEERDLLERLWYAQRLGCHKVQKIRAHESISALRSDFGIYDILRNTLADETAKATCRHMLPEVVMLAQSMCNDKRMEQKSFHG